MDNTAKKYGLAVKIGIAAAAIINDLFKRRKNRFKKENLKYAIEYRCKNCGCSISIPSHCKEIVDYNDKKYLRRYRKYTRCMPVFVNKLNPYGTIGKEIVRYKKHKWIKTIRKLGS